jgi:hypothetical protein
LAANIWQVELKGNSVEKREASAGIFTHRLGKLPKVMTSHGSSKASPANQIEVSFVFPRDNPLSSGLAHSKNIRNFCLCGQLSWQIVIVNPFPTFKRNGAKIDR